ncbi:MAG: energy transducer TonB [Thermanaerothrix sp.]|nr:energy transducer TonB [Thermanaerothrix sp.]
MGPQAPSTSGAADPPEGALELDGRDLAVRRSVPPYPLSSRRRGEEGTVVVCLWVSRGRPERGEIRSSSGHKALDEAAKRAAMDWRFKEDLSGTVLIPFRFSLKD